VLLAMPENSTAKRENAAGGAARRRLAERRKALGLTQEALAELMGVERTTVVRWERGETGPLPWMRPKLARALRISADRLEELLVPGAPAAAGGAGVPRQLPPAVAGFTGRAAELAALTKILDGAGAPGTVVISAIGGTAGVGKTALAIQWAHQAADRFPDGQLYANLRGYDPDRPTPPSEALAGFLRALGVGGQDIPPEEDERATRYRSLLAGRRVLVVLDNAGSAEQARPLLPGSPSAVLVTSRDSLTGLVARDGAMRLDLDLLPLPDAVRLLNGLIGDRVDADPAATQTLAERCCRLPLALRVAAELAAARPGQSLATLVAELADQQERLDLLDAGGDPRTAVRAVLSWSYQHLDPGTARGFRLAGLHPGADFDPYAVAALTDVTFAQANRTLGALAKAHLVQPTGPGRYGMHDLLRAYATELAATHDGDDGQHAALTRLLDHYLSTAATAMDALYPADRHRRPSVDRAAATPVPPILDVTAARSWLDGELPALTAVTQYAAGRDWAGHATRLSATLWQYLAFGGHYPEAIVIHTSARHAARQEGDCAAEGQAVRALGGIDVHQGHFPQAMASFLEARDLSRQAGDSQGEARALSNLGAVHQEQGRYRQAIGFYEQALSAFREIGDRTGEAITLGNLAFLMGRQGRYEEATRTLWQSVGICREMGNRLSECWALVAIGEVALLHAKHQQADDPLRQGLALARADGYLLYEVRALTIIGDLHRHQGRPGEATDHLREALAMCRELEDRGCEAEVLNRLGAVHLAVGQLGDARDQHAAALGLATESGDGYEQARAHDGLGHAYHALCDADEASRHWRAALALYSDMGVPEAARVRARLDELSAS
jgi:tetratricopeptide (TPR) repeat protein/transcriptional regulator with XRE-family HTH domain